MFNLEEKISDWRRQMLAAGIQSPVPLEELEAHLREEIARQIKSGINESEAFHFAAQKIGEPISLKAEFTKVGGLRDFLAKRRALQFTLSINGAFGLVWLGLCFNMLLNSFGYLIRPPFDAKYWIVNFLFASIVIGSVLLIFNSKWGRSIIRINALAWLAFGVLEEFVLFPYVARHSSGIDAMLSRVSFRDFLAEHGILVAFLIISILILHLPEKANLKTTVRL